MVKPLKTLLVGASVLTGLSAFVSAPAFAAALTGVSTSGDIRVFEEINPTQLQLAGDSNDATIIDALGSKGNVELDDNIDGGFANETPSTLTANFDDGNSIMFGSVGQADWTGGLATEWTNGIFGTYSAQFGSFGIGSGAQLLGALTTTFSSLNVFERLSDPNIASVEGDGGQGNRTYFV